MSAVVFDRREQDYFRWLRTHRSGYVINSERGLNPGGMVLHRANCWTINRYWGNMTEGGFTERNYIKVCAAGLKDLSSWLRQNGRPDGTPSRECNHCLPLDT